MAPVKLKSFEFRREREASWRELEALVRRVERRGLASLASDELMRLPVLYRAALSSLSVARAISLDRNVVTYLEGLAGRAYLCVYATRTTFFEAARDFFAWRFPQAVRDAGWQIAIAAGFLLLGLWVGMQLVLADYEYFYAFVGEGLAGDRNPSASTQFLRSTLYGGGGDFGRLQTFASFLFTHNARIGILAFALGFALGIPVFYLMFTNGLMLGAFAALYQSRGLGVDLWGWLLPHGVTELLAVAVCGGAGLVLAGSIVYPGHRTRLENLAVRGRKAAMIVLGAVFMFAIAGLIEGIFRQAVQDITTRYNVAIVTALFWIWYFGFVGRRREAQRAEPGPKSGAGQ